MSADEDAIDDDIDDDTLDRMLDRGDLEYEEWKDSVIESGAHWPPWRN